MKNYLSLPVCVPAAACAALLLMPAIGRAFPPAPPHVIYGMVRDEMGNPITVSTAQVYLETTNGLQIVGGIIADPDPSVNYRLTIPLDAGTSADLYKPTALRPLVGFRMKVKIGQTIFLPLQMTGNYVNLGKPAQSTRIDLTLGEDSDGDGLPDAWERLVIAMLGGGLTLADINPNGIAANGMTYYGNYIAGTYAWDPEDGFRLALVGGTTAAPLIEFLAITGRTYTLQSSTTLTPWTPVQFRIPATGAGAPLLSNYRALDVRLLQVEPSLPAGVPVTKYFFKARIN